MANVAAFVSQSDTLLAQGLGLTAALPPTHHQSQAHCVAAASSSSE